MEDCLYPVRSPGSAYRKGCRCDRCRTYVRNRDRGSRGYYPRDRVAQVVHAWIAQNEDAGLRQLSYDTGISERVLYRVVNGATENEINTKNAIGESVEFGTVDRLLCGIGWLHLFHIGPEDGGFADLYEPDYEKAA